MSAAFREGSPAAERRKILATAEGRGFINKSDEPQRGERIFRRYRGLCVVRISIHGLSAVAKLLRRSAAENLCA